MKNPALILYLEDNPRDAELVRDKLQQAAMVCELRVASDRAEYEAALAQTRFDLILSDYNLPDYDGMAALALARAKQPDAPFILLSGTLGEEKAVDCVLCGATDYVLKQRLNRLVPAVVRALTEAEERRKRREVEETLRDSEVRHRTILATALDGFWLVDMQGRLHDVNTAYSRMSGYSRQELLAMRIFDLEAMESTADTTARIERIRAHGADRFESRHRRKDGSVIDVEISVQVQQMDSGRMVVFSRDITEHKRAEEALRESEEKFRGLFESSRDAIMTLGPPSWGFTTANAATLRMFGAKNEGEFTSRGPWGLSPERQPDGRTSAEKFKEMIETALREGSHFYEWTHRRLGGEEFPANVLLTRMGQGGKVILQATVRDITARKRAEEEKAKLEDQFRQAQKMEAVGRLAGGVAHDFNNLLMGIMGYVELCRDRIEPGHPIREWLDEIMRDAQRSAEITRQLLAFARKQAIVPRVLDLNDAVAGMLKLLRRLIGEDINLAWLPGADLRPVRLDPSQVDQILANLCVNARDAIAGVGKITLETGNITIDADYCAGHADAIPGKYVFLAASDDGCGMDPETMAQIFEPFFTTKGIGKGTGLGLATVYGIVKQNNGFIYTYSEPDRGTTFKIYLPQVAAEAVETPATSIAEVPKGRGETILLVEDEKSLRVTCSLFLEALGYKVLVAETPGEALKMADRYPGDIHLLLTDVVMPGMDGPQLAKRLGSVRSGLKVLFMSGYTADVMVQRDVREHELRFIAKPFMRDDLVRKVREVLEGTRQLEHPMTGQQTHGIG